MSVSRSAEGGAGSLAALELDLDLFSGPFDLLLTLVLREEVDLLELQLAEVVLAYLDHLEARGELDLEAATEFIVLIAALLELKSRLMLRRRRGAARHRARAGRRGAARTDARRAPLPLRRRASRASCSSASTACASARHRCRGTCAARSSRPPTARRTRACSAPRSGDCWRCRRDQPAPHRRAARQRRRAPGAPARAAAPAARSASRRPSAAPTA